MKRARMFRARFASVKLPGGFAVGAVTAAAIVLIVILATTVDFGGGRKAPPPPAKLPPLTKKFSSRAVGASGQLPSDWTGIGGPSFVRLANRTGTAVVAITSQQGIAASSQSELNAAVNAIRHTYHSVTVKQGRGASLGGLPARSVVLYTQNARHVPIRILVASAKGPHHAYILEAFNPRKAPVNALVETQQVVLSLRLAP
jgi:hypothetical protein